jgi:hypothetical protein
MNVFVRKGEEPTDWGQTRMLRYAKKIYINIGALTRKSIFVKTARASTTAQHIHSHLLGSNCFLVTGHILVAAA